MSTAAREKERPPIRSTGTRPEAKYLEIRLRRPASAWPVLRLASVTAAIALGVVLVVQPATGLFVFWSLLVPLLPLVFLIAPGLWRSLCPMAAANQLPRFAGLMQERTLPRWLERHGYAIAALLFLGLVASRKLGLEQSGAAVAALIVGALVLAFAGGLFFHGKSAFCGGVCPLRPTQGLLGQTPTLKVASQCQPCVGCTPNCSDLKPEGAFLRDLVDSEPIRGAQRRLFAGAMPGFVVAFYTLPAGGEVSAGTVLTQLGAFSLASLGAFFALDQLLGRREPARVTAIFAAVTFGLFYWFNLPVVAGAVMRVFGAPLPDWALWQGRSMLVLLAAGWLVATLRKQRRRAQAEPSAGLALPVVPLSAVSSTASGTPSSSSPSALDVLHAPAVPPLVGSPGREPASPPAAAPRPTGGDPPVPIPDRRAPGRRAAERRADDRGHGDRRMHRFEVTLQPGGHILDAAPGSSLLDVCRAAGLPIEPGCRMGLCGNDPIYVLEGSGNLSPAGPDEQATLERLGLPEGARMACAARVLGNIVVSLEAGLEPAARSTDPVADIPKRLVARNGARAGAPQAAARSRGADPSIRRVVVLGNGIAGVTAADHVRRHHPDCEIDLVAAEPHAFYNRTSVSRLVYTREAMERMYLLPPSWYADRRITTSLNTRAARIDRRGGHVVLGTGEQLAYDRLVLATGSRPRVLPIEGFGIEGSFTLRGADDAMRLRVYAQHREARRAVIVGGGVLGLEAADAARKLGLEATIVELADRLSPVQLDRPAAELLLGDVERRGIEVLLGRSVASVASDGERVTGVTLDDGSRRAAELVVVCAGITPNAELARDAGLEVNPACSSTTPSARAIRRSTRRAT